MWIPGQETEVTYFAQKRLLRDVFANAEATGRDIVRFYDGLGLGDHLAVSQSVEEATQHFQRDIEFSKACWWNHVGLSFFARNGKAEWVHMQPIEMKQKLGL